jgi:hypothetical protein
LHWSVWKNIFKTPAINRNQPQKGAKCRHSALRIGMLALRACKNVGNIGNIGNIVVHQQLKAQHVGNTSATSATLLSINNLACNTSATGPQHSWNPFPGCAVRHGS